MKSTSLEFGFRPAKRQIRFSFLIPSYKRAPHLNDTLVSFKYWYKGMRNYEVILLHDYKEQTLPDWQETLNVIERFKSDILIHHIIVSGPNITNPSIAFNHGAKIAAGEYLILTNPECYHTSNALIEFERIFQKNKRAYIVCACLASILPPLGNATEYSQLRYKEFTWYQKSDHKNNRCLHFCTCIHKDIFFEIGGFDEAYAYGTGKEDVDFIMTVRKNKLDIIQRDDIIVIHQNHDHSHDTKQSRKINDEIFKKKWG